MDSFERELLVSTEEISLLLRGAAYIPWLDIFLNPRRLRGSDFLMRWQQGEWSESRLTQATNETPDFYAIPYGPSGVAPSDSVREYELYFERLDKAGLANIKRPDLLLFKKEDKKFVDDFIAALGGAKELPFIKEEELDPLLDKVLIAVESENSLWICEKMPAFRRKFSRQKRLGGRLGLAKNAVLPTVIIKEEDIEPLKNWQASKKIDLHIWHVFFDMAFGLSFTKALQLIADGLITPTTQIFQAPGGATTKKDIYKFYYQYAYPLGYSVEKPKLAADCIEDKNGHILPYVKFSGGKLKISDEAIAVLKSAVNQRH